MDIRNMTIEDYDSVIGLLTATSGVLMCWSGISRRRSFGVVAAGTGGMTFTDIHF
jgi:hypothetical protein